MFWLTKKALTSCVHVLLCGIYTVKPVLKDHPVGHNYMVQRWVVSGDRFSYFEIPVLAIQGRCSFKAGVLSRLWSQTWQNLWNKTTHGTYNVVLILRWSYFWVSNKEKKNWQFYWWEVVFNSKVVLILRWPYFRVANTCTEKTNSLLLMGSGLTPKVVLIIAESDSPLQ